MKSEKLRRPILNINSIAICLVVLLAACSAERHNVVSRTYHNVTARFNPYFIANEHLKTVETTLAEQHQNNYNKILKVYPEIDSTTIEGLKPQLEDALKKSSKAIDWHKNSNMVDPSYILLGRSLYYLGEFEKSVRAYKIVNKNLVESKDKKSKDVRHEALIHLMRTYIDYGEQNNAVAVSDFLRKENLSKDNLKLLYINRAYFHQRRKDADSLVNNLVKAAPLLKKNEGKAKVYFMIGQAYQLLGFDALAYNNYTSCLKYNPDYELSFYAKLNRAQVFELSKTTDVKKIRKFYRKLLRDDKNEEFKDKIYYDMAEFEIKQENLGQAIDYYKLSVVNSVNNYRQKGYSYWRLGQIYYEELKNFEMAKLYYDSTIQVMPKDEEQYKKILERQEVLDDFVTQLNTISLQDSLLWLSAMDTLELNTFLDDIILEEEAALAKKKQEEEQKKKKSGRRFGADFAERNNAFTASNVENAGESSNWYFYNLSAKSQGQNEFVRRWGSRSLEDNWRRSNKESVVVANLQENVNSEDSLAINQESPVDNTQARARRKDQLYGTIPFSKEQQDAALKKIEDAYYKLGNIYNFHLQEKENALHAFDTLLVRFEESEYRPEVLYQMYLITKDLEDGRTDAFKNQILEEFPNSIYARIIRNPNYQEESNVASEKLKVVYKKAFDLYESGEYEQARSLLRNGSEGFEPNDFSDNIRLLEILIIGKLEDVYKYQFALTDFPNQFPDSELLSHVNFLLETSRDHLNRQTASNQNKYIQDFEQSHSFVLIYNFESYGENELPSRIESFIKEHYNDRGLNFAQLILTGQKSLIVVREFTNQDEALTFFNLFNSDNGPLKGLNILDFSNFVITKDNFDIFYKTKDIENYQLFFDKHYN